MRVAAIMLLFMGTASAAADSYATVCATRKPAGARVYWSYRIVDGRPCWYAGRAGRPKFELHWVVDDKPRVVEHPAGPAVLLDPPGVPSGVSSTEPTFDQRWNNILNDMAMPFSRWRQPLKDQTRFGE